jgi:hypothetical protein
MVCRRQSTILFFAFISCALRELMMSTSSHPRMTSYLKTSRLFFLWWKISSGIHMAICQMCTRIMVRLDRAEERLSEMGSKLSCPENSRMLHSQLLPWLLVRKREVP